MARTLAFNIELHYSMGEIFGQGRCKQQFRQTYAILSIYLAICQG